MIQNLGCSCGLLLPTVICSYNYIYVAFLVAFICLIHSKEGFILNILYWLFSKHTSPPCIMSKMCETDDWRGREWKRGSNSERGVKAFCSGAPTALHIFHFPPSWKDQVIEMETIQQPRLHRCQWKASAILEYYTLGPAFVFLSHGAYGKKMTL